MSLDREREEEIAALMERNLNQKDDWFDYHNWDGFIECDEEFTDEELEEISESYQVVVKLVRIKK